MDVNCLDLLMNTKKVKINNIKNQLEDSEEEDNSYSGYNKFNNILFNDNVQSSESLSNKDEISSEEDIEVNVIKKGKNNINKELNELLQCLNKVDEYILQNNYNQDMEKINDYLIDLLFLIKTKKK